MDEKSLIENNINYYLTLLDEWEKKYVLALTPNEKALSRIEIDKLKKHIKELRHELLIIEESPILPQKKDYNYLLFIKTFLSFIFGFWLINHFGFILILSSLTIILMELKILSFNSRFFRTTFVLYILEIFIVMVSIFSTNYFSSVIFFTNNLKSNYFYTNEDISKGEPFLNGQKFLFLTSITLLICCISSIYSIYKHEKHL